MGPEDIVKALESRGWKATIKKKSEVGALVATDSAGLMKCVDGRASNVTGMRGPKTLGGVYAIAAMRDVRDVDGLAKIVEEVRNAGHVPSVHGDDHAEPGPMGCGFFKLWNNGQLDGLEPPKFSAEEGMNAVVAAGGVYEELKGSHAESEVVINLVANTTLEPNGDDQRFVVDAWVLGKFNLDAGRYLGLAAQTVELLNGPKIAVLVVD